MPSKQIHLIPNHYYHIYNRAVKDNLLFLEGKNYRFFLTRIQKYLPHTAEILAYCLMPTHYHLIVKIKDPDFPFSMQRLALSYVVPFNNFYSRKGHLFAGPYQRKHIDDTLYLLHLSRYIHLNPVQANLILNPEEWKFSSYREYIGLKDPEFTNTSIILDMVSNKTLSSTKEQKQDYKEFVEYWDFRYMSFKIK